MILSSSGPRPTTSAQLRMAVAWSGNKLPTSFPGFGSYPNRPPPADSLCGPESSHPRTPKGIQSQSTVVVGAGSLKQQRASVAGQGVRAWLHSGNSLSRVHLPKRPTIGKRMLKKPLPDQTVRDGVRMQRVGQRMGFSIRCRKGLIHPDRTDSDQPPGAPQVTPAPLGSPARSAVRPPPRPANRWQ